MAAMTMPEKNLTMNDVINRISKLYPDLKFKASSRSYWSPSTRDIFYQDNTDSEIHIWTLLHEVGHAIRGHMSYDADYKLLRLEIEAWEEAKILASKLDIKIAPGHIEDCLDTYRDWLYRRSVCPTCSSKCFQQSDFKHYQCYNCHTVWKVTPSRFCRAYRAKEKTDKLKYIFV